MIKKLVLVVLCLLLAGSTIACAKKKTVVEQVTPRVERTAVVTGIERIDEFKELFKNKRVGLITNATGIDKNFVDSGLILAQKVNLVAIFSPEHGYLGQITAGDDVSTYFDNRLGVNVFSLYGPTKKPTAKMLEGIDVLVFDIQDIGVRNYTYLSTMAYAMQACSENGKEFVVLDRPNPLGGKIEGPVLKKGFETFVGLYPIPYRHGLTPAEAALLFNKEFNINAKLTVIPMLNWSRDMYFEETGLPWVLTSPNIPTLDSVMGYAMTGFYKGLNITNGVGTTKPFEFVGATWVDPYKLEYMLNKYNLSGVVFRPSAFMPRFGGNAGKSVYGVQIHFVDKKKIDAVKTGAVIFYTLRELAGKGKLLEDSKRRLDIDLGENSIIDNQPLNEILARWQIECEQFAKTAKPYLLYK